MPTQNLREKIQGLHRRKILRLKDECGLEFVDDDVDVMGRHGEFP